uniref:Prefoldin subunit 6 n=1 Tax=Spumella elongata TaxID=89044 RepID=A0A7S3GZX8_9STRA|mmetsp:Transcript_168910/g.542998  ORF Transcript_168910/g.542998 Transcript_168910/m.542998 type:complete len:132 (-) Transcript_168910:78-473(-)
MPTEKEGPQQAFDKELEKFKTLQEIVQKSYEARMGLVSQQQETEMVKEEFDTLEEGATIFKLVGPVMVKQQVDDAKGNVEKRLEYIKGELERSDDLIKSQEKDMTEKQQVLMKMQQAVQEAQQSAAAAGAA